MPAYPPSGRPPARGYSREPAPSTPSRRKAASFAALQPARSRSRRTARPFGESTSPDKGATMIVVTGAADSVGLALLVVLESLTPAERLAFVLHDIFAMPFDEIGRIVDRTPEAARQLASRARRRVRSAPQPDADPTVQRRVVGAFLA